jgi:hypothetical protein
MFKSLREKSEKAGLRISLALNALVLAIVAVACLGVHTGHIQADIQLNGWSVGGGTAEHAAREQQLAMLSAALPSSAMTPPPGVAPIPAAVPLP